MFSISDKNIKSGTLSPFPYVCICFMTQCCFRPAGAELNLRNGFIWVIEFCTQVKWPWTVLFTVLVMSYYCSFSSRFSCLYWSNELPTAVLDTDCKHNLGRDAVSQKELGVQACECSLPEPPFCSLCSLNYPYVTAAFLCLSQQL